jgi:hypothetical protein
MQGFFATTKGASGDTTVVVSIIVSLWTTGHSEVSRARIPNVSKVETEELNECAQCRELRDTYEDATLRYMRFHNGTPRDPEEAQASQEGTPATRKPSSLV